VFSCKAIKLKTSNSCSAIEDKFVTKNGNNTTYINELQYHCVRSAMLSKKVLYDKFGKWNYGVFPDSSRHPVLFWEQIQIFENDTTKYTIATYGKEEYNYMYTSFLVLDKEGNDVLTDPIQLSRFKSRLGNLIKSDNKKNRAFFEVYWKSIDPEIWEYIQKQESEKPKK
jgi:hypothetical protein